MQSGEGRVDYELKYKLLRRSLAGQRDELIAMRVERLELRRRVELLTSLLNAAQRKQLRDLDGARTERGGAL
jgi:hypothetical protein